MPNLGYVGLGKTKAAGFPIIFVTDPLGTYIELTEGLDKAYG